MRIAFLTHEPFYPPSGGGSAEGVYLVEELAKRGHEVHVFCPAIPDAQGVETRFNIRIHEFKTWPMGRYTTFRNFKYLLYPFALEKMVWRAAQQGKFDLLLSQHTISAVAAGKLRKRLGVPVVMNFLDYLTGFMETWPAWVAPKPIIAALKNYELSLPSRYEADGIMTVSDVLADYFADVGYPRQRIQPIYYGYDAELFQPLDPAPTREEPQVVIMHGSFDQHHLQAIATEGVIKAHNAKPNTEFKFVGKLTPSLDAFLKRIRTRAPNMHIVHTGFIPYAEVAQHLARASVGIVPYEESTGTHCAFVAKIVEYLGVGIPVVSTPLKNASRYFYDEPAIRFSEFSGETFGDLIINWLNEPLSKRTELGRKASQRVKSNLDWRAISRNAAVFVENIQRGNVPTPPFAKS
jgi:glycosyltransferase involved in cell wall biosynthesis